MIFCIHRRDGKQVVVVGGIYRLVSRGWWEWAWCWRVIKTPWDAEERWDCKSFFLLYNNVMHPMIFFLKSGHKPAGECICFCLRSVVKEEWINSIIHILSEQLFSYEQWGNNPCCCTFFKAYISVHVNYMLHGLHVTSFIKNMQRIQTGELCLYYSIFQTKYD